MFGKTMPKSLGSIISPLIAAAVAVSQEERYTWSCSVPLLPSQFLGKLLTETTSDPGALPMPMHALHEGSEILAPALINESRPLSLSIVSSNCLEPGITW